MCPQDVPLEVEETMLMALADGELPAEQAQALMARIAADADLARRYAVHAMTRDAMRGAYAPQRANSAAIARLADLVRAMPVPEPVPVSQAGPGAAALSSDAGAIVDLAARTTALSVRGWGMAALAASVLMLAGLGGYLAGQSGAPVPNGSQADLLAALGALPSGTDLALPDGTVARPLATFETDAGLCRLVDLRVQDKARRLLACRDDAAAGFALTLEVALPGGSGYLPASDAAREAVDAWLDAIGAGPVLDQASEAAALQP